MFQSILQRRSNAAVGTAHFSLPHSRPAPTAWDLLKPEEENSQEEDSIKETSQEGAPKEKTSEEEFEPDHSDFEVYLDFDPDLEFDFEPVEPVMLKEESMENNSYKQADEEPSYSLISRSLITGYLQGLEDMGVNVGGIFPPQATEWLISHDCYISDKAWKAVNELSCAQQARVIHMMMRFLQTGRALETLRSGRKISGTLGLPIEICGSENYLHLFGMLEPLLPRLGLDKGKVDINPYGMNYPTVLKLFRQKQKDFFRENHLDTFADLFRFVNNISERLPEWPPELGAVYRDQEKVLEALEEIEKSFSRS